MSDDEEDKEEKKDDEDEDGDKPKVEEIGMFLFCWWYCE